jgi:hypothetical protein
VNHLFVTDIKLASILIVMGIPYRKSDPITCVVRDGNKQYSFWFDISDPTKRAEAERYFKAYAAARNWDHTLLDKEHPLYYMKAALEAREVFLGWMRDKVAPLTEIQHGSKTVLIGAKCSKRSREIIRANI